MFACTLSYQQLAVLPSRLPVLSGFKEKPWTGVSVQGFLHSIGRKVIFIESFRAKCPHSGGRVSGVADRTCVLCGTESCRVAVCRAGMRTRCSRPHTHPLKNVPCRVAAYRARAEHIPVRYPSLGQNGTAGQCMSLSVS